MRETLEEVLQRYPQYREHCERMPPLKLKPKPRVSADVNEKFAEAVKANPQTLRMSATTRDGTTVVHRPRIVEVLEVDREGRPSVARSYDPTTNTFGEVHYDQGYQRPLVAKDHDPIQRGLKTGEE